MGFINNKDSICALSYQPIVNEIAVNVLDKEGVDIDVALIIANSVFNKLKSSNIRECVRIARLAKNDPSKVNKIIETFAKYEINDTQNGKMNLY